MRNGKIAGLMLCILAAPGFANLITNGSFELGSPIAGPYLTVYGPDNATISFWTVPGNVNLDYINYLGGSWKAASGNRSLDLNGLRSLGTIYQTMTGLTVGQAYQVRFAMAGNPDLQPRYADLQVWVSAGGPPYASANFSFYVNGQDLNNMGWQYYTWNFTATSSTITLGFTSLDNAPEDFHPVWGYSFGPALDDVSVTAIPEPATLALVGLGLIAAGFLRRRR
jgi:choice-of-anchor C domain-containing protein